MLVRRNSDTAYQELGARSKTTPAVMPTALSASQTSTISSSPPATTMATATVTNGGNVSRVETIESPHEHSGAEGVVPDSREPTRVSLSISRLLPLIAREGGTGTTAGSGVHNGTSRNIDEAIHTLPDTGAVAGVDSQESANTTGQHRTESHSDITNGDEEAVWQEDSGVKACPLCDTKFTFFNRRHHCRKCGKIFCSKCCGKFCTFIPGSSVVEPEEEGDRTVVRNGYQYYKFRTCDKCYGEIKMLKEALGIADDSEEESPDDGDNDDGDDTEGEDDGDGREDAGDNESFERHLSITGGGAGSGGREWRRRRRRTRMRTETSPADADADADDTESMSGMIKHSQPREITMEVSDSQVHLPTSSDQQGSGTNIGTTTAATATAVATTSTARRQREDSELNECPVCGIDIGGESEADREAHINRCLTDQEFGSPTNAAGAVAAKRDKNRMLVYSIPADADMEHTVINDDNECVICLEEFRPGDKLGRLECLCCFHYHCIKDWIRKKGFCECPIHALHAE